MSFHASKSISCAKGSGKLSMKTAARAGERDSQNADAQMASTDAAPDVEPEADSQGKVRRRVPVARAVPVATPQPRNFFERLFGVRRQPAAVPTPPTVRRPRAR